MNHRLRFELQDGYLSLEEVWCPGDHGGECNHPEVAYPPETDPAVLAAHRVDCDPDCYCAIPTGRCWTKEHLASGDFGCWEDMLRGTIAMPWVAVTIDGPGPDGEDEVNVKVIAEVAEPGGLAGTQETTK